MAQALPLRAGRQVVKARVATRITPDTAPFGLIIETVMGVAMNPERGAAHQGTTVVDPIRLKATFLWLATLTPARMGAARMRGEMGDHDLGSRRVW